MLKFQIGLFGVVQIEPVLKLILSHTLELDIIAKNFFFLVAAGIEIVVDVLDFIFIVLENEVRFFTNRFRIFCVFQTSQVNRVVWTSAVCCSCPIVS